MKRLILIVLTLAVVLLGGRLLMAQTQPASPQQETFVIFYEPGAKWVKDRPVFEQDLREHGQYMSKLLEQGHLVMGGPFSDNSGGMAVITAQNADEAAAILCKDPGVTNGVFKATVRPWYVVFRKAM